MPFLDELTPNKKHVWLNSLYKKLLNDVGVPCKAYRSSCISCRVWAAYDVIRELYEHDDMDKLRKHLKKI